MKLCPEQVGGGAGVPAEGLALAGKVGHGQAFHTPGRKVRCTGTEAVTRKGSREDLGKILTASSFSVK